MYIFIYLYIKSYKEQADDTKTWRRDSRVGERMLFTMCLRERVVFQPKYPELTCRGFLKLSVNSVVLLSAEAKTLLLKGIINGKMLISKTISETGYFPLI